MANGTKPFYDYAISGSDVKAYLLIRKGYVKNTSSALHGSVDGLNGAKVSLDDDWVGYEIGMLRMLQFSSQADVKPINTITSSTSQGNAVGRSLTSGRMVFRNTNKNTLYDIKERILTDERFDIKIMTPSLGVDFEEDITSSNVDKAVEKEIGEVTWGEMPNFDILFVTSDENQIEYPRVCRFKDLRIGSEGTSDSATDTEDNEFCDFIALSGYTPWRTLKRKEY